MKVWPVFFHAPHRVMFMAGATQGLLAMLWWLLDIGARLGLLYALPTWPLPPTWIHAALMIFGFFPFFMFGFLMTAGPRWVAAAPVARAAYVSAFVLMGAGWFGFYAALWLPLLLVPSLALALAGWCAGLPELVRLARSRNPQRAHILIAVAALVNGALCLAALLGFAAGGPGWLADLAITGGVWFYLLPVFVTVGHRMIPFFSSAVLPGYRVVQPAWALYLLVGCGAGHGMVDIAGSPQWSWLFDVPAALIALFLSVRWQLRRSLALRLLAVLHIAFAWLGVALALYAAHSLSLLAGRGGLGLAPLHALTIGFFASLLLGMVTRVTLGHSGRGLGSDVATWGIFLSLQGVALLRVAGEFAATASASLMLAAAIGWLAVFGWWYAAYVRSYVRPRSDGEPG